jgi:AraC-like DNA-binding protein
MLGIFDDATSDLNAVARLGSVGVLDVLPAAPDVGAQVVCQAISRGHIESLVGRIWRLSSLTVAEDVATVLRPAVRLAHSGVLLPRLAAATKLHERSLRKYCEAHGLPSPQWIIGWARTLVTAYYLEENGRSVQSISSLLGFSSPALMANHLRRYTGETASTLRRGSPLLTVARKLEQALLPSSRFVAS